MVAYILTWKFQKRLHLLLKITWNKLKREVVANTVSGRSGDLFLRTFIAPGTTNLDRMIVFLEALFDGWFAVFCHLTIRGGVYVYYGTLSKTSSCSKWGYKHSWYKNRLVKTRCLSHLKQLPRRFTLCLSAPLRTTRELLKRVLQHIYTGAWIVKCQKTRKHPSKSASRNSIILSKFVVSGGVEDTKKGVAPDKKYLRQPYYIIS